jgi:outer membrane protein assembly factor BamA
MHHLFSILLFLTLFIWSQTARAKEQPQFSIDTIIIEGLDKTNRDYVKRYINIQPGAHVDSISIIQNGKKISSLIPIAKVETNIIQTKNQTKIIYICEEVNTLLPVFNFGLSSENQWVVAGVQEYNLGGKGRQISGIYQYYDRHSYFFHFLIPYFGNTRWGMAGNFKKWSTNEPLYIRSMAVDYFYDNNAIELSALYEFGLHHRIELGSSYFTETYTKINQHDNLPGPKKAEKNKFLAKCSYLNESISYHYFYQEGWANSFNFTSVKTVGYDPLFVIAFNEFRYFYLLSPKINIAGRLKLGLSTNNNNPFAPFVLDNHVNIRGIGNKVDRGTGTIFFNLEYRHTLYEKPFGGIQGVLFTDSGSWRKPGGGFDDFIDPDIIKSYSGIGLRFIHKRFYNAIFRVDYGFNMFDLSDSGIVIGLGQYF